MKEKNNLDKIILHRMEKLARLRKKGINPYPHNTNRSISIDELVEKLSEFMDSGKSIVVCGRIITSRDMGKTSFVNVQGQINAVQLYISEKEIGDDYSELYKNMDIGDIIEAEGIVFKTKTGEFTLRVSKIRMLSKSTRPLPNLKEKDGVHFDAFDDKEHRYRNRHLDFIANPEHKNIFIKRAQIISSIRKFLDERGFLEVETPVLQPIYGGANARPFTTFHNTLEQKLYLRIATELYLKRLIIGGFDKVYELSKDFRNEGMDRNHNPEFTMLEYYSAFADMFDMINLTESLIKSVAKSSGINKIDFMNNKIDFTKAFNQVSMIDLFDKEFAGKDILFDSDKLYAVSKKNDLDVQKDDYPKLVDKLFSTFIEPQLIQPTFVLDYPLELSPLSKLKRNSDQPIVERFELFVGGMEIANAFTELNDPQEQRIRMESQEKLKDKGDKEATEVDDDFIYAMEAGMPPAGGVGIGIDRLVMLITGNKSIKDVILFPALRPENPK